MDVKTLLMVSAAVFIAELGDKTPLATMLFASESATSKWTIFLGTSAALVLSSAIVCSPATSFRTTPASSLSAFGRWCAHSVGAREERTL